MHLGERADFPSVDAIEAVGDPQLRPAVSPGGHHSRVRRKIQLIAGQHGQHGMMPIHTPSPRAALAALLLTLGLAAPVAAQAPVAPVPSDMSPEPAAFTCPAERPTVTVAEKQALQRELTDLAEQARKQVEGSDAELAIKAKLAGRLMSLGHAHKGCEVGRDLLRSGPSQATMELLRCQQRRYCGAPAVVRCPTGTVAREVHGCEAAARCSVSGWAAQQQRCFAHGDPACCSTALIVREYEQLEAGVAALPANRAGMRKLAEHACEVGISWACTQAAAAIELPAPAEDEAKVVALRRRACALGRLEACKPASTEQVQAQARALRGSGEG